MNKDKKPIRRVEAIVNVKGEKMNIWKCQNWRKIYNGYDIRSGLHLKFDNGIDDDVKIACKEYCKWLRKEYYFPMRVPIYIKNALKIQARDGELVYGTFLGPYDFLEEPYIRIAAGDYQELSDQKGQEVAITEYLYIITHELTHYFQWINQIKLTDIGEERQAARYANIIIERYMEQKRKINSNINGKSKRLKKEKSKAVISTIDEFLEYVNAEI